MAAAPPTTTGHGGFVYLDAAALRSLIPHSALISHLRSSLPSISRSVVSPSRQSFPLDSSTSSSLLLMPAWSRHPSLPYVGLKAVTSFPRNSSLPAPLPGVHAAYLLFSSATGAPLAALDGTALTLLRTSAASALAAAHLARPSPRVLVLAGTGSLGPHLISAHRAAHPTIRRVIIWNRTPKKACDLALKLQEKEVKLGMKDTDEGEFSGKLQEQAEMNDEDVVFEYAENLDDVVGLGDIVSCATGSERPIVKGKLLKSGAHLDLVGSFTPLMRECDDDALLRGRVFVDFEVALEEAGELVGAFQRGIMKPTDVVGTLVDLVSGAKVGRSDEEVTVYKSVGTAVVDILAAQLAYENYLRGNGMAPTV